MIPLDLLGVLDRCGSFSGIKLDLEKIPRIYYGDGDIIERYQDIRKFAVAKARIDISKRVDRCTYRARRLKRWRILARLFRENPVVWRWSERLERALLANSIV